MPRIFHRFSCKHTNIPVDDAVGVLRHWYECFTRAMPVEMQAVDRTYRIGQTNKVIAVRMITPDPIEEKTIELQGRKKKLVEDWIHADSGFFKQLSKEDLPKLV